MSEMAVAPSAEEGGDAGADAEKAAETVGRGAVGGTLADTEQFRGNTHGAAEQVGVDAVSLAEGVEPRELLFQLLIGEGDLILLRLASVSLSLLASELRGEVSVAGAVVGGRGTIGGALAKGVEGSVGGAETLLRDGGLLLRRVALTVQQAGNGWQQHRTVLLALLVRLRDELILLCELLVGETSCGPLCCA
jgi:hypothetical protein